MRPPCKAHRAFTLIELLVVIAIIGILVGLLFPALKAVQNQARSTQAKNDLTQIVNAVNAFYTDYGLYPLGPTTDNTYGSATPNNDLLYTLRAVAAGANAGDVKNARKVVFISPPNAKDPANPRSGIGTQDVNIGGVTIPAGSYLDPWGRPYRIVIDGTYDNQITNAYTADTGAGPATLRFGAIGWSIGADQTQGTNFNASDDVISWQ
jgi:prepilin-type N-terminal cleavage/methylation domain-containing protein